MKLRNKKGIINWFFVVILLAVIAMIWLMNAFIFHKISDAMMPTLVKQEANTSIMIMQKGTTTINGFDLGFGLLFFGLGIIVVWGSASILATYKWTIPVFLILFVIIVILSVALANMYGSYTTSSDEMAQFSLNFPVMNFIFSKFPFFVGIIGLLIMISTYAKTREQNLMGV